MHTWIVVRRSADCFYAITRVGRTTLRLHHHLWPDFPAGSEIDHRNRNGKDNRRANLRNGEDGKNENNHGVMSTNKGYLTGVSRDDKKMRWRAYIGSPKTDRYRSMWFSDAKYDGDRDRSYAAACAQRTLWAEEAGNRNGLEPR
jgi:hypothetical protein